MAALAERGQADVMGVAARRRLHRLVRDFPGLHLSEVARQAGLETNHAKYHLDQLARHGLVSALGEAGRVRFYPRRPGPLGAQEALSAADKRVLAILRQPVPLQAVVLLADRGTMTHAELEAEVPVRRSTLHYHMAKLVRAGIVQRGEKGRERTYDLADPDRTMDLLMQYRPPDALVKGFLQAWEALRLP